VGEAIVEVTATVVSLGLTIGGDVASFGAAEQADLASNLRSTLSCVEPICILELRLSSAGSIVVDVVLTIPETSASSGATNTSAAANVAAAAQTLVAAPASSLTASLGVSVQGTTAPTVASGIAVPLVVAPPPPSPPPPTPPPPDSPPPPSIPLISLPSPPPPSPLTPPVVTPPTASPLTSPPPTAPSPPSEETQFGLGLAMLLGGFGGCMLLTICVVALLPRKVFTLQVLFGRAAAPSKDQQRYEAGRLQAAKDRSPRAPPLESSGTTRPVARV
jgi:hypothetical protein